jgi:hypothetical protein
MCWYQMLYLIHVHLLDDAIKQRVEIVQQPHHLGKKII